MEASGFRDAYESFRKRKVVVLGVSPDIPKDQKKFHEKFKLPFSLLCDTEKTVARAYGALKEKRGYGRTFLAVARTTFLIGAEGQVVKVFPNVRADGHANEVLATLA